MVWIFLLLWQFSILFFLGEIFSGTNDAMLRYFFHPWEIGRCPTILLDFDTIIMVIYTLFWLNASDFLSRDRFYIHWYKISCNFPNPRYYSNFSTRGLGSKCPCSACIFQVVVSLLICIFHIFNITICCTYCISMKGCGREILWRWSGLVSGVRWRIQYAM